MKRFKLGTVLSLKLPQQAESRVSKQSWTDICWNWVATVLKTVLALGLTGWMTIWCWHETGTTLSVSPCITGLRWKAVLVV